MSDDLVIVERDGHVLKVGVNRPDKRNAWNRDVIHAFAHAYERIATEDGVRCGVMHGIGDHFSAGLDLADVAPVLAEQGPEALNGLSDWDAFGMWGTPSPRPVVLAVQGIAFTLSIELALASDIVIAADDVRFRQLEIGRGIIPFGGATVRAARQLGHGNAMRWLLTAEEFGAEEALRIGLVQEVVTPGAQLDRAMELAHVVARQAPLGVAATLANSRIATDEGKDAATRHLREMLPVLLASNDAAEGVLSFVERRDATFTGT